MFNIANYKKNATQATMRYYLILVRMAILKKSVNNKGWRNCGEKGTLLYCLWECKLVYTPWKTVWRFLKKPKAELPYDIAIPLLDIYTEKTLILKDMYTAVFNSSITYKSQHMEGT